jgi:hypothetical protein
VSSGNERQISSYRYELRHADATIAPGYLSRPEPLQEGDLLEIAGLEGKIEVIWPIVGSLEQRLIVGLIDAR